MSISVVILAAGAGSRMKSSTPKVLHKICGKEMLFYSIKEALKLSDDVHIVLFFHHQKIKAFIEENFKSDLAKINFHLQDHDQFPGTGGALMQKDRNLIPLAHQKVLILNGDMPLVTKEELEKLTSNPSPLTIGILELKDPSGYGRVIIENNKVKKIIEEKDATQEIKAICSVNAGVYAMDKSILQTYLKNLTNNNVQQEYYLTDIIHLATKDNIEISPALLSMEHFLGVNSKLELSNAENIMLNRLREKAMLQGVIMHMPQTIYLEADVEFEGECELYSGVCIKGQSKIINSIIKSHSVIEDSILKDSDIGPMAHLRPKCEISQSHIGNFVEVKAGKLSGVKAGHLSYLGDCEIDEGSNIGAGVITCNYDGKKKHKTIIGKNVFIGSDSQLVAPLNIQSDVLVASGTTMTKDANQGDLIVSRVRQENKSNGFYRFFGDKK